MRIAIISPFSQGPSRGNITTVNRISRNLAASGADVTIIPVDSPDNPLSDQIRLFKPHILHAFHGFYCGPAARAASKQINVPYLITVTGSDIFDPAFRDHPETVQALHEAGAITCFDMIIAEQLADAFPFLSDRLSIIPQGVEPFPPAPAWPRHADDFIILLPAALRPVKGISQAIDQLAPLAAEQPRLRLWIAGGVIDEPYAAQLQAAATLHPWVSLLGEIPYARMGSVYAAADLVLNSSLFEGGMANALLEAMVMGKPVVAADIPGNRSLIQPGETGWLYSTGEELRQLVSALAQQPDQRQQVGRAAKDLVTAHFSPLQEAVALLRLYRQISGT